MKRKIFKTEDLQKQWDKDNYLVIPFLDRNQIIELDSVFERFSEPVSEPFHLSLWTKNFSLRKTVNDLIAPVFSSLISEILVDYKPLIHSFATKMPGENSGWHIHQDDTFTDENLFESLSFWIPFIDADAMNGTISIVKNSHLLPNQARCSTIEKPFRNILPLIQKEFLSPIAVKAGEALVFSHRMIHSSGPNSSTLLRNAVVGVYVPVEAPVLYYYKHAESNSADELQLPDDYYLRFPLGDKPEGEDIILRRKIFPDTRAWTEEEWIKFFPASEKQKTIDND